MPQELNEIRAENQSIRALLRDEKYRLDFYQREYSWETKQVEELLSDLEAKFSSCFDPADARTAVANYPHYFLGSVVISRKGGQKFVIDGQQRLTTLTLLLIYLHHLQAGRDVQVDVTPLIFSELYGRRSFNLDVDERRACMEALLEGREFEPPTEDASVTNLRARYADIDDRFPDSLRDEAVLPYFIDWLLLNVDLVEISAYNDEDAYTIFETMNDRGKPLSQSDMLKGYLLAGVGEPERQKQLDALWKRKIVELHALSDTEDADFFKAWLRSQYAMAIRQRQANAQPQDFDKLGTEYNRVVRDDRTRFRLGNRPDFERFIERQMVRFADRYMELRWAEEELTGGLEYVRYNATNGFTVQPMLCLAPLRSDDDPEVARLKMQLVASYLDIFVIRRAINWRSLGYSTLVYTMFLLMKDLRELTEPAALAGALKRKVEELDDELPWDSLSQWALHSRNVRYVRNLLARVTAHVEAASGMASDYDAYITKQGPHGFDIEHIWASMPERHADEFANEYEFAEYRNRLGGLLLMPAQFNRSYGAETYEEKLPHYAGQNLLARSLSPLAYEHHPGFARYREHSGADFRPIAAPFTRADLDERQALYLQICREIFSPSRFDDLVASHSAEA